MDNNELITTKYISSKPFLLITITLLIIINIGFATISSTLKIRGSGFIGDVRWDIHFENLTEKSNKITILQPATIIENTTEIEYSIKLNVPGSYYEFETDIKNGGTIDAQLATEPTISGITEEQDVYTNYVVTYSDDTPIRIGDIIKAGESRKLKVRIEMEKDITASQLPTTEQQLNLIVDLNYIQAD